MTPHRIAVIGNSGAGKSMLAHRLASASGAARCAANCRARPWEPHKYATQAEQDARLPFLLEWVEDYYRREGEMSHAAHRALFDGWTGPKQLLRALPGADFRIAAG